MAMDIGYRTLEPRVTSLQCFKANRRKSTSKELTKKEPPESRKFRNHSTWFWIFIKSTQLRGNYVCPNINFIASTSKKGLMHLLSYHTDTRQ
jgi:hypothetical protein